MISTLSKCAGRRYPRSGYLADARPFYSSGAASPPVTFDLTDPTICPFFFQPEGGMILSNFAGTTAWGSELTDDGLRFKDSNLDAHTLAGSSLIASSITLNGDSLIGHVYQNGSLVVHFKNNVRIGTVTLPNTGSYGNVVLATGFTGLSISTAFLQVRAVLDGYGDSIMFGQAGTGGDSSLSFLRLAANILDFQPRNHGNPSEKVSTFLRDNTSQVTAALPPAYVVVNLCGANDVANGTPINTYAADYLTMIERQQMGGPTTWWINEAVLKQSLNDTAPDPYNVKGQNDVNSLGNLRVVWDTSLSVNYDGSDGIHPGIPKQPPMASALATKVLSVVGSGGGNRRSRLPSGLSNLG